ncbi:hypothetical protein [Psychromonas sp. CD1]|uniref:hypothetical protein n=1 Tax=Psychromonas sp. CD1 TaxID=1979839 RepID=UPI000B9AE746|nr:hypothetical protein [Psychromonas sp. CD1]
MIEPGSFCLFFEQSFNKKLVLLIGFCIMQLPAYVAGGQQAHNLKLSLDLGYQKLPIGKHEFE